MTNMLDNKRVRGTCSEAKLPGLAHSRQSAEATGSNKLAQPRLGRVERRAKLALVGEVRRITASFSNVLENLPAIRETPSIAGKWMATIEANRHAFEAAFSAIPCSTDGCLCHVLTEQANEATKQLEDLLRAEIAQAAHGIAPPANIETLRALTAGAMEQIETFLSAMECAMTGGWRWR